MLSKASLGVHKNMTVKMSTFKKSTCQNVGLTCQNVNFTCKNIDFTCQNVNKKSEQKVDTSSNCRVFPHYCKILNSNYGKVLRVV